MTPSLYVHIPFCRSRCGYCSFVSGCYDEELASRYVDAVLAELKARGVERPSTLFLGGGTPSMLSPAQLERLLGGLPRALGEASCEANPDSISGEKLRILREYGINRLSIGVQTFSPEGLRLLGRAHDAGTAVRAVEMARGAGFENISLDLINGWPGQDEQSLQNDLKIATNLPIRHISCYSLIIEPSCHEYARYSCLMSQYEDGEERDERYWQIIQEFLENKKFIHYETSNYALSDFTCRHNVAIWRGGEYFGVGIAAHSHLNGRRFSNTDDIEKYVQCSNDPGAIEVMSETLPPEEKARECAVFWLRLFEGIDVSVFEEKTGYTFSRLYGDTAERLFASGLLEWADGGKFIRVPKMYQPILDAIVTELV